ncbi:MAG: (Fe-S)-binding protein [Candidatus Hodarchaeota archaeon]
MVSLKKNSWIIKAVLQAEWSLKKRLLRGYRQKKKKYYPSTPTNADIKNLINCMLCPNMCRFDCPAVQASKRETHAPATKSRIAYYLEMDRLEKTPENILPLVEGCTHCDGCKVWCPFDFSVGELLEVVAIDLFQNGALPGTLNEFIQRIRQNNGLYPSEKYESAIKTLKGMDQGEVYYFPGCTTMAHMSQPGSIIHGIVKISTKADVPLVARPKDRWCCGAPSLYAGDLEKAKELALHNRKHIRELKPKVIICECPECAYMLREQYSNIGAELKIPVLHVTEWLLSLLGEEKITLSKEKIEVNKTKFLGFHDPCVLARKLGITDAPRQILHKIAPETLKESPYSGKYTHCCGFGGLVSITNPEIAAAMSKQRLGEFVKLNIDTIVSCCPTCELSFLRNDTLMKFEIKDLIEVVASLLE